MHIVSASQGEFSKVKVDYIELPGWETDTTSARKFADLPENAQNYVLKVEDLIGVPGKLTVFNALV